MVWLVFAPPLVSEEWIVYFPFDQYALTPDAASIVAQAAAYGRSGGSAHFAVVGYMDTSGAAGEQITRAENRAMAVAQQLNASGVPMSNIEVEWKGTESSSVPGGREPLTRRATITVSFGH